MSCILLFTILYFDVLYLVFYCPVSRCSIVTCLLQLMFCLVKIPAFSLAVLRLVPYCPKYCLMMSYVLSHAVPSIVLCCPTSCLFSFVCLLSNVLSVNCKFAFWSLPLDILLPFGSFFLSSVSVFSFCRITVKEVFYTKCQLLDGRHCCGLDECSAVRLVQIVMRQDIH